MIVKHNNKLYTLIAPQAAGEVGAYQATFDLQVASALPRTVNNSIKS
jgi:hypothetical protein